jgi:hypothetical protein
MNRNKSNRNRDKREEKYSNKNANAEINREKNKRYKTSRLSGQLSFFIIQDPGSNYLSRY